MATTLRPVRRGPFLGVNNRLDDVELRGEEGAFLRSAVNAYLTARGRPRRRDGYERLITGAACHSFFADGGEFGYYADGSNLYRVRSGPSGLASQVVRSNLTAGLRLSYDRIGEEVWYSNGVERGILTDDGSREDWGDMPDFDDPESPAYLCQPTPPGTIVRRYRGRLLVVRGTVLYISEPWSRHLWRPARGRIPFNAPITVVATLDTGVYVAAGRTYWLAGELASTTLQEVFPFGGAWGSDVRSQDSQSVLWRSDRGLVRGLADGTVQRLQEPSTLVDTGVRGATLFYEVDGMQKAISSVSGRDGSNVAARSYMSAEIIRKGIQL